MIQNTQNIEYTNDLKNHKLGYDNSEKIENLQYEAEVIEGYFPKELYEKKMSILDAYAKLNAAEEQVKQGKVLDADKGLKSIREKYNV